MIPDSLLQILASDVEAAEVMAADGEIAAGYSLLDLAMRAHETEPRAPWASDMVEHYRRALAQYGIRHAVIFPTNTSPSPDGPV